MKLKQQILAIFILITFNNVYGQGSYFTHDTINDASIFRSVVEHNNNFLLGGSISLTSISASSFSYLLKIDSYGNTTNQYISKDSNNQIFFGIFVLEVNFIRLFSVYFTDYKAVIRVNDLDSNLQLFSQQDFIIDDTAAIGGMDVIIDEDSNFVISGGIFTHPLHPNVFRDYSFLFKLSPSLDSLVFNPSQRYYNCVIDNPYNKLYYTSGQTYDFDIFNRNLDSVGTLRVDTFFMTVRSHLLIDTNKFALISYIPEVGNQNHKIIVIKTIDTLGNDYKYVRVDAIDTISTPGFGRGICQSLDSNFLYFTWIKNNNFLDYCNYGEPSYIGVGKFDKDLNQRWIRYFGNDTYVYKPNIITSTTDGGVLITGYYLNCLKDYFVHYFILKVDSLGECTFMKELPYTIPNIQVFPNPATTHITLDLGAQNQRIETLNIFTITGQKAISLTQLNSSKPIDIQNLKSGIYLLEGLLESGERFVGKFVKE
jgi:hypothetical protein